MKDLLECGDVACLGWGYLHFPDPCTYDEDLEPPATPDEQERAAVSAGAEAAWVDEDVAFERRREEET